MTCCKSDQVDPTEWEMDSDVHSRQPKYLIKFEYLVRVAAYGECEQSVAHLSIVRA